MPEKKRRAEIQPREAVSDYGLRRTIASLEVKLDRCEKTLARVEKRLAKVEAERDEWKARYTKAQQRIREQDKTIKKLVADNEDKDRQLKWLREQKFGSTTETKKTPIKTSGRSSDTGKKKRGQQPGSKGHGRSMSVPNKDVVLLNPANICCEVCRVPFKPLPGTDNSCLGAC